MHCENKHWMKYLKILVLIIFALNLTYSSSVRAQSNNENGLLLEESLDEVHDYVETSLSAEEFSNDIATFSGWIYPTSGERIGIIEGPTHDQGAGNERWDIEYLGHDGERISWQNHGDDSTHLRSSIGSAPLDTWTHFTVVYDRSETNTKIYINGELDAECDDQSDYPISFDKNIRLGISASDDDMLFSGKINDLQIYDRALTQEGIGELHDGTEVEDGLVANSP